jgi:mannose-6-phosphate isomerase-like protein (cupin superfamily)
MTGPGYTVLRPGDEAYEWKPPSWRPEDPARRIVELTLHAPLESSRANLWRYPPGASGRRHRERNQEEVFVVLEGTLTMELGDNAQPFELPPQSMVAVLPGTALKLSNRSDRDVLVFAYGAPAEEPGGAIVLE